MHQSSRTSWEEIRRELGEHAYGVLAIDVIAVLIGGVASRHFGSGMWLAGAGLAAYVTLCFVVLIAGDFAIQYGLDRWDTRRHR